MRTTQLRARGADLAAILADARRLTLQTLHCGPEPEYSDRADEMSGVPVGKLVTLPWRPYRNAPQQVRLLVGDWPTGVYTVRLTAKDGRVGFAPFVVRPKTLGDRRGRRSSIPTNTWQAYNFYDADGDGFGDTWYAGGNPPVVLTRPYRERGVPPRFHRYDAPYLRWLSVTGKTPDYVTDDDLETIESGDELRQLYDLVVFPGHTEYETAARLRRRPALPRPRRAHDLPLRERVLLEGQADARRAAPDQAVAKARTARGRAARRPVPRERQRRRIRASFVVANAEAVPGSSRAQGS